jgi:hypothetical protein
VKGIEVTEMQKRQTEDAKGKAKALEDAAISTENELMLNFCRRILTTARTIDRFLLETKGDAFVNRLHASLPKLPSGSKGVKIEVELGESDERTREKYVKWANQAR